MTSTYIDLGGTYRVQAPEQTIAMLMPLLAKMGITRIANITGLDNIGIPVVTCIRPNSKHLSVSQGKGATLLLAKVSAIMESVEGYHVENPPEIALQGSFNVLQAQHQLVDPNYFRRGVFSEYDLQATLLDWVQASELYSAKPYYIPRPLVQIDSTSGCLPGAYFDVSSNGLAAGNTFEEALCHALYEVIERDSLFRWQRLSEEQRSFTKVSMDSIDDEVNNQLLAQFSEAKQTVDVWDIRSSIGIPAFHCAIQSQRNGQLKTIFTGTGAHINKTVALSRAMTEAAQGRLTVISGNRDDIFPEYYQGLAESQQTEITNTATQKSYQAVLQPVVDNTLQSHVDYLKQQLAINDCVEIFVVEHTKSELGIAVVQVFIPGLKFNGARLHVE